MMPLATSITVHVTAQKQQILRMSNHSELRDLRSEGIHFKNKYKFMILQITLMPQIKKKENLLYNIHSSSVLMSHL